MGENWNDVKVKFLESGQSEQTPQALQEPGKPWVDLHLLGMELRREPHMNSRLETHFFVQAADGRRWRLRSKRLGGWQALALSAGE